MGGPHRHGEVRLGTRTIRRVGTVEKWLKKHQSQFRGKASAFKKHVADICSVFQASEATKQDLAETAVRYGLQKKHADRMSFHNLSTFIGACQFQAA